MPTQLSSTSKPTSSPPTPPSPPSSPMALTSQQQLPSTPPAPAPASATTPPPVSLPTLEAILATILHLGRADAANFERDMIKVYQQDLAEDFGIHISPDPKHHLYLASERVRLLSLAPLAVFMFADEDCEMVKEMTVQELKEFAGGGKLAIGGAWRVRGVEGFVGWDGGACC
ncbi:hypothetical protein BJ508DRAFT_330119 [Ascobolus immersus RN42]|uniref:Uncharacterized protein n=1 Tax=Ascobolus immersus RN42 TaxID=1160509 RepID=A0A3N4HUE6_ASCIM|nr:hypothetical protein BJ508DRAFT_330119 [Ascobolus immersus RN42]